MLRPGPLDFPGSCWNGTTAVFSDWFIQHVLQSGFDQLTSRRRFRHQSPIAGGGAAAGAGKIHLRAEFPGLDPAIDCRSWDQPELNLYRAALQPSRTPSFQNELKREFDRGSLQGGTGGAEGNDHLLHTGASGGSPLRPTPRASVIRTAGGGRLPHGRRRVGFVHLQLSGSVSTWESLYE